MPATALNTILLGAAFVGMIWWWRKGFSLPSFSNPLTGGAANTTIQSVVSVQTFIVMAVFAAFELTLWKTNWLPELFGGAGLWHIPYYGALIYLVNLISEKTTGDRKIALMRTMFVVFALSGVSHLVSKDKFVTWWNAPPPGSAPTAPAVPDRRVARTPTEPCDNIYRTYHLNNRPKPIIRTDGCIMDWRVTDDGTVILTDAEGRDMPYLITKDTPDDLVTPLATKWRSRGSTALVEARFYRP
jgi:hypothetical protein